MSKAIAYDDLEYTPEGVFLMDGLPFTGVTNDNHQNGRLACEVPFVEGREHGLARDYFPDGRMKGETPYILGRRHGTERDWFENGTLKHESIWEFGVVMRIKEWSLDGDLIKEYTRSSEDHLYKLVEKGRQSQTANEG